MARVAKIKGVVVAEHKDGPVTWFVSRPEAKDDDGSVTVTPAFGGRILNSEATTIPGAILALVGGTAPEYPTK